MKNQCIPFSKICKSSFYFNFIWKQTVFLGKYSDKFVHDHTVGKHWVFQSLLLLDDTINGMDNTIGSNNVCSNNLGLAS